MLDELATYLAAAGLGLTVTPPAPNLFTVPFPAGEPHLAVCLITFDASTIETFGESLTPPAMEIVSFKVIARAALGEAAAAFDLATAVYRKLRRLGPVTLSGVRVHNIQAAPPVWLGLDDVDRPRFHFDGQLWRAEAAA